jgi:DNA polymerase-1
MPDATSERSTATETPERRTIALVDGNSLMHRAFHAIPPTMTAPDGRPTNAIFGFASMLQKLIETFRPDGLIIAFDKGKPKVRMEMLPQYKAQRPPMDPALHEQFPMVKDLLRTMDVPVVELEGWEGDDILGTLARRGEASGYEMLIVTGDRDMYQLSTDHVKIVTTKKGLSDVAIMTPESVQDLYGGITPELVPDFYGLKGDSSDNIPGVPGIGPKKASALIMQYGNLDEVIAHADEVKGKMGENLRAHVDDALLSRKVATIRTDAPVELDLADARFPTFDAGEVRRAFAALGFNAMANRMASLGGDSAAGDPSVQQVEVPSPISGAAAQAALEGAVATGAWLGVAVAHDADEGQMTLALGDEGSAGEPGITLWVATARKLLRLEGEAANDGLVRLFGRAKVASGDVKALLHEVYPVDSSVEPAFDVSGVDPARIFDVGVAAYLLDSSVGSYPVGEVAERYLDRPLPKPTDEIPAAALEAVACRALVSVLEDAMQADTAGTSGSAASLFHDLEMPLLPVLAHMERTGLAVDTSILAEQSAALAADIDAERQKIYEAAGEEFNIDSPSQLSHVLFDVIGLPTAGLKKTRSGFYSTNARVLDGLAKDHEVVAEVLDYREKNKIRSTYLETLPGIAARYGDGRVHTTLNQTVTATGRLSSSNPNLQNIPTRSELGHHVRTAFSVPEGSVFLACDYSQIELRLLAHLSGDEHLIEAFCEGADFHSATASRVFGIPVEEVTHELRSRAKAVNFGIVYGQQAYGLSQSLKIPMADAQEMIDRYFEAYPGVRRFLDETVAFAREHKWVATMWGRKRHIPDIGARNPQARSFAERTAMNHPMQGSAADIIKIAMVHVEERLRRESFDAKMVLQIHDELDFEVPESQVEDLAAVVREEMQNVVQLKVPLLAEPSWGKTWAEAK